MGKLLAYLKYEGIKKTASRCVQSIINKNKASETVFLRYSGPFDMVQDSKKDLNIVLLTKERMKEFDDIRFFHHISGNQYIGQNHGIIALGYLRGQLVAYAAGEYHKRKEIHGLGFFQLDSDEAWVGPVYVKREYRGQGINRKLVRWVMALLMKEKQITCFYTCINKKNTSSLNSFLKIGFIEQGAIVVSKSKYRSSLEKQVKQKFVVQN